MTRYLPLTLTLRAPMVVTEPGGDPNSAQSLAYLPGGAVRGAVAAALERSGAEDEVPRLVLDHAVRYLNCYPTVDGARTVPAPLSWRASKRDDDGVWDVAAFTASPDDDHDTAEAWPSAPLAGPPGGFVTLGAADLRSAVPVADGHTHHQRDRRRGRAWAEPDGTTHGAVFSYEGLRAGQSFGGLVAVDDHDRAPQIADRLQELLARGVTLGRSRRAGYGGSPQLEWGQPRERELARHEGVVVADLEAGQRVRVLLTSPYVGRDPHTGQADPTALTVELRERLPALHIETVWWGTGLTGGYNRRWGLPLPQRAAVAAGSVLVCRAEERVPLETLLATEHAGLGERRGEGFGRLLFLVPAARQVRAEAARRRPASRPQGEPPAVVLDIERRILADRLDLAIEAHAATVANDARRVPSASLLGRLRVPLRGEAADGLGQLRRWLSGDEGGLRSPARNQLERCRLSWSRREQITLSEWLRRCGPDGALPPELPLAALAQACAITDSDRLRQWLEEEQAQRLRARLVDALLAALQQAGKGASDREHARGQESGR